MKLHDLWKPIPAKPAQPAKTTRTGVQPARPPQPEKPPPKPHPPVPPSHPSLRSHPRTVANTNRPSKSSPQSRASKRIGRSRRRWCRSVRVEYGDGPPSGDARDRGSRTRNGPDGPRPPLRACPRHPPLGLGTRWSCRWVLLAARDRIRLEVCGSARGLRLWRTRTHRTGPSEVLPDPRRGQSHKSPACGPVVRL